MELILLAARTALFRSEAIAEVSVLMKSYVVEARKVWEEEQRKSRFHKSEL